MPDETRVFDISRPGHSSPNPTSKPIIVGHHPTMADPMVNKEMPDSPQHIPVNDTSVQPAPADNEPLRGGEDTSLFAASANTGSTLSHSDEPTLTPSPEASDDSSSVFPTNEPETPSPEVPAEAMPDSEPMPPVEQPAHVEGLHVETPKRRGPFMKILLLLLVLLVAGYLLIDSGVIKTGINLPLHIFKQKKPAATATSDNTAAKQQAAVTSVPAGFTEYKIAGTSVTFAAPAAWGTPTSATDPGYSTRGGAVKSDGTYAYLVDFATNKDVEIAVTSAKYLPTKRPTLYYDFLQWCVGTNDGKFYETAMHFTTSTDKLDTPSTTSCDQGPVAALKVDDSTIVQAKAASTDGKVIGDIYTKNLQNTNLPVFRVKDATSVNGADIKQLLTTVKVPQT